MFSYEKWDKISPIADDSAENWLKNNFHLRNGNVYLIKINDMVSSVESINVLKRIYHSNNETDEYVLNTHIKVLESGLDAESYLKKKYDELNNQLLESKLILMKEGLI